MLELGRRLGWQLVFAFVVAGCGGSSFSSDGAGGSGNEPGKGGDAGKSGSSGTSGSGGSSGISGGGGSSGISGSGGSSGGGGCIEIACPQPICDVGWHIETPPGECCPVCVRDVSPHASCAALTCQPPPTDCPQGYTVGRPPGACCTGCVPTGGPTATIDCTTVDCVSVDSCPDGYSAGHYLGQCCDICVPDIGYCEADSDCMMADKPRSCCGCPEPISARLYEEDPCWYDPNAPRSIPDSCYPEFVCGAPCAQCPPSGAATCSSHHCREAL